MQKAKKLAFNSLILFSNTFIKSIATFFVTIYVVRYLGAGKFGQFSVVFAYLSFFKIVVGVDLDRIVLRELSKKNNDKNAILGNAILIKLAICLLTLALSWIILQFTGYGSNVKIFIYIASVELLFFVYSIFLTIFQATHKIAYYATTETIIFIFINVFKVILILLKAPLFYFIIAQILPTIFFLFIYIFLARKIKEYKPSFKFNFILSRRILILSFPLILSSLLSSLTMRIDQIMVFNFLGKNYSGYYASTVNLVESLNFLGNIAIMVIYPLLNTYYEEDKSKFKNLYKRTFKYLSIAIFPIAVGTTFLSKDIITLLYGIEFIKAADALKFLIWSEIFIINGMFLVHVLYTKNLQNLRLPMALMSMVINLVLNYLLIPEIKITGASIATVLSYFPAPILFLLLFKKSREVVINYLKYMLKPFICAGIMGLFIYFVKPGLNMFIIIPLSGIIYFILLIISRTLNRDDLNLLKEIIKKDK